MGLVARQQQRKGPQLSNNGMKDWPTTTSTGEYPPLQNSSASSNRNISPSAADIDPM
jgi:hypothetical protein